MRRENAKRENKRANVNSQVKAATLTRNQRARRRAAQKKSARHFSPGSLPSLARDGKKANTDKVREAPGRAGAHAPKQSPLSFSHYPRAHPLFSPSHPLPARAMVSSTLPILPGASQSGESPAIDNGTRRSRAATPPRHRHCPPPHPKVVPAARECKSAIHSAAPLSQRTVREMRFVRSFPAIDACALHVSFSSGRIPGIAGHACDLRNPYVSRRRAKLYSRNE